MAAEAGEGGVQALEVEEEEEEEGVVQEEVVGVSVQAIFKSVEMPLFLESFHILMFGGTYQTIKSLKGGRGGGGSRGRGGGGSRGRGRGRGGNIFKKSGPDDPRIGSSVQIFVEGLPQVRLVIIATLFTLFRTYCREMK